MSAAILILYSREGCCLCEGLERSLRALPLNELNPPLNLDVVDIDNLSVFSTERVRYDLAVPVLTIQKDGAKEKVELPRVSPRLEGIALLNWLQKILINTLQVK